MKQQAVVVVGAGIGGLCAAVDLARRGLEVTVVERAPAPGGKMRQVSVDGVGVDAGPTVFTMRWIFESLFADAGSRLDAHVQLGPLDTLARHGWDDGSRLDLFADMERSAEAIAEFAGPREARGYRAFCARSARVYEDLVATFIAAERPSLIDLVRRVGVHRLRALFGIAPWPSMWAALGGYFRDPRLRQLFARYATYVGSSPVQTPATLMLVAHVEQEGVWTVRGGMHALAQALVTLGQGLGVRYRFATEACAIEAERGRCSGVALAGGERLPADAVVFNGDSSALADGRLGPAARAAVPGIARANRSLSALTWCLRARCTGFPLHHHTVFFSRRVPYPDEFRAIFSERRVGPEPTVYVCAQDRRPAESDVGDAAATGDPEHLLMLINAPPDGDRRALEVEELDTLAERTFSLLARCGLHVEPEGPAPVVSGPGTFNTLFPSTGGALYGRANHGMLASFARPGAPTRLPGLYLAGGSAHPGAGVPMAAMSGRLAAERLYQDLAQGPNAARTVFMSVPETSQM